MKKLFFLLGGVVTLTACSEDVLNEIDKTNTYPNSNDSGSQYVPSTYTGSVGDGNYKSPWNVNSLITVGYAFDSYVANWDNIYVRVTPYIGLAYYDGDDDGTYNTPTGPFNLAAGNYPNLFAFNKEYGNYVQANPIVLGSPSLTDGAWYTHELYIQSKEDHCPLVNIPVGINYNLYAIGFDIIKNAAIQPALPLGGPTLASPPPAGTADEERLLSAYGKVFYYKVEYSYPYDPLNYHPEAYYVLSLEVDNISDPEWSDISDPSTGIQYQDVPFGSFLRFYDNGGGDSQEIVVDPTRFQNDAAGQVLSGNWFTTASGMRKITTMPNGFPLYYPPGSSTLQPIPGAEPRNVAIYFE